MSYKWPDKDPDEIVDYSIDWSRFLGTDTLTAADWFIDDAAGTKTAVSDTESVNGLQFVQGTLSDQVSTARFNAGTHNVRYNISCRITTGAGLKYERAVFLRVREK
jgi:hypothetical protein